MLKEGIVIGERYEVISRVGSGGMADVYKSRDHKLNRLVAVKVLKPEFRADTTFVSKFQKEAQSAAGLSHPNIVNVYDVGEDRGLYYIVMELVEGITLKKYITKKGKLSIKEATSIAIQVSLGLEAAHNQGIIHRDVKPQNIIISTDGKVKLSDFGIAKAINSNTITANVMGSVHYSSPEQVRGGFADAKSDIYSLGITMYEMVTGRVPFDGDTTVAIAIKHLQEEMVAPSRYTPDLPYSLEQIILKCTQKNPERRYGYIGELIEDLKQSLIDPQGNFVRLTSLAGAAGAGAAVGAAAGATVTGRTRSPEQVRPEERPRYEELPEDDADDVYDEEEEDDDDGSDAVSNKLEKAITIGGFLIGAVIIIILIVVIGNMAGLFNKKSSSTSTEVTPTVTAEATEEPTGEAEPTVTAEPTEEAKTTESVTVPNFVGMTLDEATKAATDRGITVKQTGVAESSSYPEGSIIRQDVEANETVEAGTSIGVVVSSGQSTVSIPTGLAGKSQADAEKALTDAGLTAVVEQQNSDTVAEGCVISTNPAEGTGVLPGTTVTLYVSAGPETPAQVAVPDVVGYDAASAASILSDQGFGSTMEYTYDESLEEGVVISTNPAAGTMADPGTQIILTVNSVSAAPASDSDYWVGNASIEEPEAYMGGYVDIILSQDGYEDWIYSGSNPWENGTTVDGPFYGLPGVSSGNIQIYEEDTLIAEIPVAFSAP